MATYYWVGGSGTWNQTSTTNWSLTSGGAGGAGVPTSSDDVIFDANSSPAFYSVTISSSVCRDISINRPQRNVVLFSVGITQWFIYGSFNVLSPYGVYFNSNNNATVSFLATTTGKTINTNGVTNLPTFVFNAVGGEWTLLSALNITYGLTINAGSLITNNYNVTFGTSTYGFYSNTTSTRSINLGSSTITCGASTGLQFVSTGLTFNAGTSQINLTNATGSFAGADQTFYNVTFTNGSATVTMTGANTFNNLDFGTSTIFGSSISLANNITVNGTLSVSSNSVLNRKIIYSASLGTQVTITAANLSGMSDLDFADISGSGAASWIGTRLGNRRNNSGITFDAPKTVYWNLAGAQNWTATGWATSSGGTPAANNFPLPQDTAVFDNTGSVTGNITMVAGYGYGNIDMSARTTAMTLVAAAASVYGNWTNGSGITLNGAVSLTFSGSSTQTIISAGKTIAPNLVVDCPGSTVQLGDAFNSSSSTNLTINRGTFTTGTNYSLTAAGISSNNSNTRSITLGSSSVTLSSSTPIVFNTTTNLTFNAGTSTITFSLSSVTITSGNTAGSSGLTYYNLTFTGSPVVTMAAPSSGTNTISGTLTSNGSTHNINGVASSNSSFSGASLNISGSNNSFGVTTISGLNPAITGTGNTFGNTTFSNTGLFGVTLSAAITFGNLTITSPSTASLVTVPLGGNLTISGTFTIAGGTATNRVFVYSNTLGTTRTITANAVSLSDVDFRDITGAGSATWTGTRIGDCAGNSGITFTAGTTKYWNLTGAQNWAATGWATSSGGTPAVANFPLAQDTAIFNNAGAATTVTMNIAWNLPSIDLSARSTAMTFALSSTSPFIYGTTFALSSGITFSGTGTLTFAGRNTQTITSAGKTSSENITINSPGGTVQLADALNIGAATLTVTAGTFTTGTNYSVTSGSISSNNSNTRAITLGSSAVALSATTPVVFTTTTGLTLNAGTSTITNSGVSPTFNGAGLTYYNVTLSATTSTTVAINGANTFNNVTLSATAINAVTIAASNTFNNLTITSPSSAGYTTVSLGANQTLSGTLTVAGGTAANRVWIYSSTTGTQRTVSAATTTITDVDFRDIVASGAASWSGTRIGNAQNNTGITFDAQKTVYWNLTGSVNWNANGWASTSGGAPAAANYPLPQDIAIFNNTGAATTVTLNGNWNLPTVDFSARTNAMTFATGTTTPLLFGDWKWGTGVTVTGTGAFTFNGRNTQTITSNAKAFTQPIIVDSVGGTVQLADALNIGANTLTITNGSFNTGTNYNLTAGSISSNNSNTRSITLGSSTVTLSGSTSVDYTTTTNLTYSSGTSTYTLTNASPSFAGGGLTHWNITPNGATTASISNGIFNNLTVSNATLNLFGSTLTINDVSHTGTTAVNISNSATIRDFTSSATTITVSAASTFRDFSCTSTAVGTHAFSAASSFRNFSVTAPLTNGYRKMSMGTSITQTFTGTLTVTGSAPTRRVVFWSSTTGTTTALSGITGSTLSDVDFSDIVATGSGTPLTGTRIGDLGNNTGVTVSTPKTVYWNLAGAQNWSATGWATSSGGTPNVNNFPLPQDTAVFDNTGSVTGTITQETTWYYPNIDFSARTSAMTFATVASTMQGSWKNGSGVTYSNTSTWTFSGRVSTYDIDCGGSNIPSTLTFTFNCVDGTYQFISAFLSLGSINHATGTLNANGYNVTMVNYTANSAAQSKTLNMGSGSWTLSGVFNDTAATSLTTITFGSSCKIYFTSTSASVNQQFYIRYYPEMVFASGSTAGQSFNLAPYSASFAGFSHTKSVAFTVGRQASSVYISFDNWSISGTSSYNVTVNVVFYVLLKYGGGNVSANYLNITNTPVLPASTWYAGANSIDNGGNTNWIFTAPPVTNAGGNYLLMFYP